MLIYLIKYCEFIHLYPLSQLHTEGLPPTGPKWAVRNLRPSNMRVISKVMTR